MNQVAHRVYSLLIADMITDTGGEHPSRHDFIACAAIAFQAQNIFNEYEELSHEERKNQAIASAQILAAAIRPSEEDSRFSPRH